MDLQQLRADGNAIKARQLFTQQAAFQPGVDGLDLGLGAVLLSVDLAHQLPQGAFGTVFPGGVIPKDLHSAAQLVGQHRQALGQHLLLAGHAAAHAKVQFHGVILGGEDTKIEGGLHQAGQAAAHGLDAIGNAEQHAQHPLGAFFGEDGAGGFFIWGNGNGKIRLGRGILMTELALPGGGQPFQRGEVLTEELRGRLIGDGVILGTAGQRNQAAGCVTAGSHHQAAQQHIGIGATLINFHPRVTAHQLGNAQGNSLAGHGLPLDGQTAVGAVTAGTADGKDALCLRIQVDHIAAGD